jgi:hypothetical protein
MSTDALPQPQTIDEVIARMEELAESFERKHGPEDGVLCFNRLYLAVTRAVKKAARTPGFFDDPETIERLDVIFASLYFDAVDAIENRHHRPTMAWRVLFKARDRPGILPLQFAVAGMNAHINHDLPFALLDLWRPSDTVPARQSPSHEDFTKVNQILKDEELSMGPTLEPKALLDFDKGRLDKLEDRLAMWAVDEARARAWETAEHLWVVRDIAPLRDAWVAAVDVSVGGLGRAILEPV